MSHLDEAIRKRIEHDPRFRTIVVSKEEARGLLVEIDRLRVALGKAASALADASIDLDREGSQANAACARQAHEAAVSALGSVAPQDRPFPTDAGKPVRFKR